MWVYLQKSNYFRLSNGGWYNCTCTNITDEEVKFLIGFFGPGEKFWVIETAEDLPSAQCAVNFLNGGNEAVLQRIGEKIEGV